MTAAVGPDEYVIGRPDDPRYDAAMADATVRRFAARAMALREARDAVCRYSDAIAVVSLTRLIAAAESAMADAIEAALRRCRS